MHQGEKDNFEVFHGENNKIEKLLKPEITLKSALRLILILSIFVFGFLMINFSYGTGELTFLWIFGGIILLCFASSLVVPSENKKRIQKKTIVTLECLNCGKRNTRDYQNGDYIFKEIGECPKCKSKLQIIEIFSKKIEEK